MLSKQKPTRSGYAFAGWSTVKNATIAAYQPGGNFYVNKITTLYAIWKRTYTISYNANGGNDAPASQTKIEGTNLKLRTQTPWRSGYTYAGWSDNKTSKMVSFNPGSTYSRNAAITLYAVWKRNYKISYSANGGNGAPTSQTKIEGLTLKLSNTRPTRVGYAFMGWSTIKSATIAGYQPGGNYYANGNVTLYAVWKKTYKITYYANGGKGGPSQQIKYEGTRLQISYLKPTRTGYRFSGWSTNKLSKTGFYQPGQYYYGNAPLTLFAIWKK